MSSAQSPNSAGTRPLRENTSSIPVVKAQINFLVSTLSDDNFERNCNEIRSLCDQHGLEAELHVIRTLIRVSALDPAAPLPFRLLAQETRRLSRLPSKAHRFRDAIERGEGDVFRVFDFPKFAAAVGLSSLEKVILAAGVALSVTRSDLAMQGKAVLASDLGDALSQVARSPSFDGGDLPVEEARQLLSTLLCESPLDVPLLGLGDAAALLHTVLERYGSDGKAVLMNILPTMHLKPHTDLAAVILSFGNELMGDVDIVYAILSRFGITENSPPSEQQILDVFGALSSAAVDGTLQADMSVFVTAVGALSQSLEWSSAVQSFDQPLRQAVDTPTLKLLVSVLLSSPRDVAHPAVKGLWSVWSNTLYQLRLLDALLSLPSDTFSFVVLPGRRIITTGDVASASATIKGLAVNVQNHTWNSFDLLEFIVNLVELDNRTEVTVAARELLEKAIKISPELTEMGLLKLPKPWSPVQTEYIEKLLDVFLAGHPNHQLVLFRVFQTDEDFFMTSLRDFYEASEPNVTRILDIAQDLKILDRLLSKQPFIFALDLAALASRREYLNLEKWLNDSYSAHGDAFCHATMEFLDHKIKNEMPKEPGSELRTLSLNAQTIAIFLAFLRRSGTNWSRDDIDYFREIRNSCLQLHPRLMNLSPGSDQEPGMAVVSFAPDIEAESETIFKRMYEEETSVDSVLQLLHQYKVSTAPRDHEVFACMLHTLFDEYKFFPVYPARELSITAILFGSLIEQHLVEFIPLGIAIRYVLDALRQPSDSNMFQFGIQALVRFQSRLGEWHELCHALLAIPHFQDQHADLAEVARRALFPTEGLDYDDARSDVDGAVDGQGASSPPFHALAPDNLQDDEVSIPSEQEADQMLFIVNNLAINNCEVKSSEMRDLFKDEHARWFAHYLVDQRISSEPNNHGLYIQFVDLLSRTVLHRHLLNEAFVKARVLLNSDTTVHSAAERSVLKNLGSWIGLMTLAKDKPIKHRNLAFKSLLVEGYDANRLVVAIPFVCKILEQCAKSTIFHSPNPWLMGLIRLLAEFYHYGDLVLNLKFEIEVLCIALDIDLDKIEATDIIRARAVALENAVHEGFIEAMDTVRMDGYGSLTQLDGQVHRPLASLDATPGSSAGVALQTESIIAALDGIISINPDLGPYAENERFKRFVQLAIESAVREIIIPVVDRSVTIASISTQQLVAKDFAMEADEERMREAAHLMVKNLAGNLALVTCKEPLRINMISHLRTIFSEQGIADMFPEQTVLLLVQDNLNAACNVIEKAAMDRAVAEVDKALEPAYLARFRHREQRPGQPFWHSVDGMPPADYVLQNRWPDMLRLSPAGLSLSQTRVYEDFGNIGNTHQSAQSYARGDVAGDAFAARPVLDDVDAGESELEPIVSLEASMDRLNMLAQQLNHLISESAAVSVRDLGQSHDITMVIKHLLLLPHQTEDKDKIGLAIAQRIVQLLYKSTTNLSREVYVYILQQLLQSLPDVQREVVQWLVLSDDERKLNVPVTLALLRVRLIDINDLDSSIGHAVIRDFRPSFVDFAASLVRETLVSDPVTGWHHQFPVCYEALLRAVSAGKGTDLANALVKEIQGPEDSEPYSTLASYFRDWVRSYHQTTTLEATFIQFVTHPEMQGILRGEDISSLFFRVCMEVSADRCVRSLEAGYSTNPYLYVDALSKLIAMIIKYHGEANNEHAKAHYLTKSLSIIVLVLAHAHEESDGLRFESRPFFRLFSSLLNELQSIYSMAPNTHFQLLLAFSDTFNTLQPSYFPGFAFAWIGLVSHRAFMARMLHADNREGWAPFHRLLVSLLRFLAVFLRTSKLETGSRQLYLGSLRILVVLLHDFPEFLSEHYFTICEVIPPNCIQLRNVVLSAFPSHLKLPDPLGPRSLAMEHVGPIPPILFEFATVLKNAELRTSLDQFLLSRGSQSFPSVVKNWLLLPDEMNGTTGDKYNVPILNALVMYIGVSSVAQAKARSGTLGFVPTDPGVQVLQRLSVDLDLEGQHHLLSAIAAHLRYPNAHTHWFSSLMLHLFSEIQNEVFQEILTKVLLERFLVEKPHPWGVIATLAELLRQPRYAFWSKDFLKTRGATDLHQMLEAITNNL